MSAHPPRVSGIDRGLRLGGAAFAAGAIDVLDRIAPSGSREARGERSGRVLMQALLELRGAALKVAQFLSLESDLLPDAVTRELSKACYAVPSMGAEFARSRVRAQIGPIEEYFASFGPEPFAAASLGQVHAATTLDGRHVAVKLQYPGMADTVRSDLRLLKRAVSMLSQRAHYRRLLDEIESRLIEECDYTVEAEALGWFGARLSVPGVAVAQLVPALSTSLVLCTSRLPGKHLDEWLLDEPDPAVRNRAGQRLYDVFIQSLQVLGRLHADPNPGNVLFCPDGSVGLLDFGCTRWISPDCQQLVRRVWRAAIAGDDAAAHAVYRDMGLFAHLPTAEAVEIERRVLRPFLDWLSIPFRTESFDFGVRPGFVAEGRRLFTRTLEDGTLTGIRPEFVLVNRTIYGLYRQLERLRARVRCQTDWTAG